MESLFKMFTDGGIFMYPIGFMLILASMVIAERLYSILFVYNGSGEQLMSKVRRLILDNNVDEAVKLCNARKRGAINRVFKAALMNADRPFEEIQEHVEVSTLAVVPSLQNRMPYLFTIANVATLLGLLGTIQGLIQTFEAVGAVEGSQKQVLLSAGISTAMITTAFGLIVAIPCMLVYGFLFNKINSMVDEIEHYSSELLLLLRTGQDYFNNFEGGEDVTTQQTPAKKDKDRAA